MVTFLWDTLLMPPSLKTSSLRSFWNSLKSVCLLKSHLIHEKAFIFTYQKWNIELSIQPPIRMAPASLSVFFVSLVRINCSQAKKCGVSVPESSEFSVYHSGHLSAPELAESYTSSNIKPVVKLDKDFSKFCLSPL